MKMPSQPPRWAWGLFLAALFLLGEAPSASAATYVVQRNDTLSQIARRYGVDISELQQFNKLKDPHRIYAGQVLRIPAAGAARRFALDEALLERLEKIQVEPGKWEHIVLHHTASPSGTVKAIDRYHREERRMENGLAYHFLIGNGRGMGDGEIAIGRRWAGQIDGGHLASLALNQKSIGICLVGNFDREKPTGRQMESLRNLVLYLMDQCQLSPNAVRTHGQMHPRHTRCPGQNFPAQTFVAQLRKSST